jgi:hypothetical protein
MAVEWWSDGSRVPIYIGTGLTPLQVLHVIATKESYLSALAQELKILELIVPVNRIIPSGPVKVSRYAAQANW